MSLGGGEAKAQTVCLFCHGGKRSCRDAAEIPVCRIKIPVSREKVSHSALAGSKNTPKSYYLCIEKGAGMDPFIMAPYIDCSCWVHERSRRNPNIQETILKLNSTYPQKHLIEKKKKTIDNPHHENLTTLVAKYFHWTSIPTASPTSTKPLRTMALVSSLLVAFSLKSEPDLSHSCCALS